MTRPETTEKSLARYMSQRHERQRRHWEEAQLRPIIAKLYEQGGHRLISQYLAGKMIQRRRQSQAELLRQLISEVEAIRREMILGPGHGYVRRHQ